VDHKNNKFTLPKNKSSYKCTKTNWQSSHYCTHHRFLSTKGTWII